MAEGLSHDGEEMGRSRMCGAGANRVAGELGGGEDSVGP